MSDALPKCDRCGKRKLPAERFTKHEGRVPDATLLLCAQCKQWENIAERNPYDLQCVCCGRDCQRKDMTPDGPICDACLSHQKQHLLSGGSRRVLNQAEE